MTRRKKSTQSHIESRHDGFVEQGTGRGTLSDKVTRITPSPARMSASEARQWYLSNGFIQNIVDGPAEDAMREWITIRTNRDEDNADAGTEGLAISRMIDNRLTELGAREKITSLVKFSRLYPEGGFLFFGVEGTKPQTDELLKEKIPADVLRLAYLNVISSEYVSIFDESLDPLSSLYHQKRFGIRGVDVHPDRMAWMVHSYIPEERRGISVVETVMDAILAQDTSLWSVNHLVFEMSAKIFKSPKVDSLPPDKLAEFVAKMKATMSTHSAVALTSEEEYNRLQTGQLTGMKELFDYIFENLAGLARMPKSRLMGQSQGVITAGQFDLVSYYDTIAKFQELEVRPVLEKIIDLVVRERNGDIYRALNGAVDSLDWEFEFNPLWRIGPVEQADIELKEAQRDQIYVTATVLSPDEIRQQRFADLEEFAGWESQPVSMIAPEFSPAVPKTGDGTKTQ